MTRRLFGLTLLGAGLFALMLKRCAELPERPRRGLPKFVLEEDAPELGLQRDTVYRVDPEAPIYLGDPVAVRGEAGDALLRRYEDGLIGSVIGLVIV